MKEEEHLWILGNPKTILTRMENQDVLIVTYRHMAKECRKPRKNKEIRKCYKCEKIEQLAKDCRSGQKMKTRSIQEESDKEDNEKSFVEGSE